jgi:hypothetical protein
MGILSLFTLGTELQILDSSYCTMRDACKFNVQIHNGSILVSSVTKDPGVSSILLFSDSGINFPRPLYIGHFFLSTFLAKIPFLGFFYLPHLKLLIWKAIKPFMRSQQMTQNKINFYSESAGQLEGYINFCFPTHLNQVANSIKNIPASFCIYFF